MPPGYRFVSPSITYARILLRSRFLPGLHEEGLFRRSPTTVMLKQAQEAYDRGNIPHPIALFRALTAHFRRTSDFSGKFWRSAYCRCLAEEVPSGSAGANFS